MDDFLNSSDDNISGLQLLQFAPNYFFSSLSPVTFTTGYDWINVYCTSETSLFSETTKDDENGGYQEVLISGQLARVRPDLHALLAKYRMTRCVVKVKDQNGNLRMAGNIQEPLLFTDNSSSGRLTTDDNGYAIYFKGNTLKTAPFL